MLKKLLSFFIVAIFCFITPTPALACKSHNSKTATSSYSLCDVKSCVKSDVHSHNDKYYYAHYYGDGHKYHEYCDIEDCTLTGYHEHNGDYCFGHAENDGHDYHRRCSKL